MFGLPASVTQALNDTALPPTARLLMWHLAGRLDVEEWRPLKHESLALETRVKSVTVSASLARLVREGYLCERRACRQQREYRLPVSRRPTASAA